MSIHSSARAKEQARAEQHTKKAGYARGGAVAEDEKNDRAMVKKAVAEHEEHDHKGEPRTKLRIKRGGKVDGKMPMQRLDKRARGGHVGKPPVNVIINSGGGEAEKQQAAQAGMQQGVQLGARAAIAKMSGAGAGGPPPGAPPGSMPPAPGMPPGAPPPGGGLPIAPHPPMAGPPGAPMRAKGGALKLEAGAGGGTGRLEKNKAEGGEAARPDLVKVRGHKRRKAGGAV